MSKPVITVENLSKSYMLRHQQSEGGYIALRDVITDKAKSLFRPKNKITQTKELFWALKDVSFEVNQGDRIGIIGRNGAGKSTLLKILSRIVAPTTGKITIEGRVASLLEVGTGFHPELTGRENIFLNGAILGMNKSEIKSKFDEIVDFSGVEKFLDTPVKRFSSGMYVRLAFAVAAHLEPEILIIDEVLAVGDAEFQKKCLGKMEEVSKGHGRTILFVSHNLVAIQKLCDKAIVLNKGQIDFPLGDVQHAVKQYIHSAQEHSIINLKDRKDRQGEGKIRLINFKFLNQNNELQSELITGQTLKLKMEYESTETESLNNVTAAIAFYGDDGVLYTVLGNEFSSVPFSQIPSNGSFICEIKKFPLVSGRYMLNLVISQNGIMQDWVKEAVTIDVESGDYYGTGKILPSTHRCILIENDWRCI